MMGYSRDSFYRFKELNDKRTGAILLIMQRLHEDDLVGHVLGLERWEVLSFPAIAESDEEHRSETIWGPRCFRRRQGEPLHPDREPLEVLHRIRQTIGEYNFAGQYQQAPAPLGGGLVKIEWFKRYRDSDKPEGFDRIVQSWDTANKATELSDYSVCTTWGVQGKHLFLIGPFRRRLEYPALKRAVREQQNLFNASVVLIEDKASGTQLIQDLIAEGCHGVTRYQPTDEKTMRMHAQTAVIENGFVHLPETAPWLAEYLHELAVFPNGKHDDQADSTAQFLDWFKRPFPGQGLYELMRRQAERSRNRENADSHHGTVNQPLIAVGFACGRLPASAPCKPPQANTSLSAATALSKCGPQMPNSLIPAGWTKLAEWTTDEDAAAKRSKPQPVQTVPQLGSMEWLEAQKKKG